MSPRHVPGFGPPPAPVPIPRPFVSVYDPTNNSKHNTLLRLYEFMANGWSMTRACQQPGMAPYTSVSGWVLQPEQAVDYAQAKQARMVYWAEQINDIADDSANDFMEDDEGNFHPNPESVSRAKIRIDARKWLLSKLCRNVYGDVASVELSGPGGGPLKTEAVYQPTTADIAAAAKIALDGHTGPEDAAP